MSHDAIGAQNQPLTPLNKIHGRSNNGIKTHKHAKVKETKPAMEICDVKINDATMDLELAGRLTSTAIDQFLFFMNQVPFPVSRLAKVPAPNDKAVRLRGDFITAYTRLLNDIKLALCFSPGAADGYTPSPFRIVITLGSIMMPKSAMLFQIPSVQGDFAATRFSVAPSRLIANRDDSSDALESDNELPPDSDSDHEELSEESGSPKVPTTPQSCMKTSTSTPLARSPFIPFRDTDTVPMPSSQLASPVPASQNRLSPRPNLSSRSPASPAAPIPPPSNLHPVSDENQTSRLRLEKRFKAAERELTVALSNLDLFTEETELSKIHVYLHAPRTYTGNGWHPRASATKTLDSLTRFPNVDVPARTKLGRMNACAIRVTLTDGEITATDSLNDAEELIWLEWEGKLTGVE